MKAGALILAAASAVSASKQVQARHASIHARRQALSSLEARQEAAEEQCPVMVVTVTSTATVYGVASTVTVPTTTTATQVSTTTATVVVTPTPPTSSSSSATPTSSSSAYVAPAPVQSSAAPVQNQQVEPVVATSSALAAAKAAPSPAAAASPAAAVQSTVATSSTSSSNRLCNTKKGLAYNDASLTDLFSVSSACWAYNWGYESGSIASGMQYVPMLHDSAVDIAAFNAAMAVQNPAVILAYNEPDMSGGGGTSMTYQAAAQGYIDNIMPYKGKSLLGAIAVTSEQGNSAAGIPYLENWASACTGCHVDVVPFHWYGGANSDGSYRTGAQQAQDLSDYLTSQAIPAAQKLFGSNVQVWVTEYGAYPAMTDTSSEAQQINSDFLSAANTMLEANPNIAHYSAQMAGQGQLVNAIGNALSELGSIYLST